MSRNLAYCSPFLWAACHSGLFHHFCSWWPAPRRITKRQQTDRLHPSVIHAATCGPIQLRRQCRLVAIKGAPTRLGQNDAIDSSRTVASLGLLPSDPQSRGLRTTLTHFPATSS